MAVFNAESRAALSVAPPCRAERGRKGEGRIPRVSRWPCLPAPPVKKQYRDKGRSVPTSARDSAARPRSFMQSAWWQSLTKNPARPLASPRPVVQSEAAREREESPAPAIGRAYPRRLSKSDIGRVAGVFPPEMAPPARPRAAISAPALSFRARPQGRAKNLPRHPLAAPIRVACQKATSGQGPERLRTGRIAIPQINNKKPRSCGAFFAAGRSGRHYKALTSRRTPVPGSRSR